MSQNQIFNMQRFGLLINHDVRENWRKILLSLGGLLGALIIIGLFYAVTNFQGADDIDPEWLRHIGERMALTEVIFFTIIMFFAGAYVASTAFKSFSSAPSALSSIMIPASQFEKFMVKWLVAVPCFFIIYVAFAMFADWVRVAFIDMNYHVEVSTFDWNKLFFHSEEIAFKHFSLIGIMTFFCVQSFFLLGSIVWPRVSFLKTFVSLFALGLVYGWFNFWFYDLLEKPDTMFVAPEWLENGDLVATLVVLALTVLSLFNYCLTFMRFREAETIVRW